MKSAYPSLIIGLSLIIGVYLLTSTLLYRFKTEETISVTGLSEKDFSSDLIVWNASFTRTASQLRDAYASLKQDETAVRDYLHTKGIADSNIVFSSVNMTKNYRRTFDDRGNETSSKLTGYSLTESVRVESRQIDKVETLSREITELLEKGIELSSDAPEYYYTRLNELKIDLLAKASEDARIRAETIAQNSGGSIGQLTKATMGVFQITGRNANEDYSYGGVFNTSSKLKTASITLKVNYKID